MTGSSGQFMLSNPQLYSGTSTSGSTADSAASGSSTGSAAASSYMLRPQGSSVNLGQYVNQRVRVTGVLENGTATSAPISTSTPSSSSMQTFVVTSIQPVGGSCP